VQNSGQLRRLYGDDVHRRVNPIQWLFVYDQERRVDVLLLLRHVHGANDDDHHDDDHYYDDHCNLLE
jgi:hypothetical protein